MEKKTKLTIGVITLIVVGYFAYQHSVPELGYIGETESVFTGCDVALPKIESLDIALNEYKIKEADNSLRKMSGKERATFKGCEIAKYHSAPRETISIQGVTYDIEIVSIKPIEEGVEVFARAWTEKGRQVGFGADGTVDKERFVFNNPPILVADPNGPIESVMTSPRGETVMRFREDPLRALQEAIVHTISVKKDKSTATTIVPEKEGRTTYTFYPTPGSQISHACFEDRGTVWSTHRNSTTCRVIYDAASLYSSIGNGNGASAFSTLRPFNLFDTSSLPDSATISSAVFSLYVSSVGVADGSNIIGYVVAATPASNSSLVIGDFDQVGAVDFGNRNGFTASQYNDWTLNASGIAAISLTSITKYAVRGYGDFADIAPTDASEMEIEAVSASTVGTSQDPKLVVETADPVSFVPGSNDIIWYK